MAFTTRMAFFHGILDDGQIELRITRQVSDDLEMIGEKHHRQVLAPGQDVSTFPLKTRRICTAVWTPEVIEAYLAAKAARSEFPTP